MKPKSVLVTGGCGFVGSHIVDELLRRNIETYVIDDLSTGDIDNIGRHLSNPLLHLIQGNVSRINEMSNDLKDVDVVFHEAAIASVIESVANPSMVFESNVVSTYKILEYCRNTGVNRIIFASSSSVYGDLQSSQLSENENCRPISPYGAMKIAIEHLLYSYWKTYGLKSISLRYFNVYGLRQQNSDYSGVITIFMNKLLRNHSITIFGDGKQIRDFVNIYDVVSANMLAMESLSAVGESINIGTGVETSILGLSMLLRKILGKKHIPIIHSSERNGDIKRSLASVSKAKELLGYTPSINMECGLNSLVPRLTFANPAY